MQLHHYSCSYPGHNLYWLLLHKLQLLQNSAARIITGTPSINHITAVLQQLHWLLVKYHIEYKVLLLTFKALHNLASSHVSDLLQIHTLSCDLRSSHSIILVIPRDCLTTMGSRSFNPCLWTFAMWPVSPVLSHILKLIFSYSLWLCCASSLYSGNLCNYYDLWRIRVWIWMIYSFVWTWFL